MIAPASLCLLSLALRDGEVTRVIPVSSVYPLVTVLLAFFVLNEQFSLTRVVGTAFVVLGVVPQSATIAPRDAKALDDKRH